METKTEKVTITDVESFESKGKTLYKIRTADGRTGMSGDNLTEFIAKPTELVIKPGNEYKGVQQYYFNLPKENGANGAGKKFPPKDYTSDKKMNALTNAVASINIVGTTVKSENILALADKYFEWLNKK